MSELVQQMAGGIARVPWRNCWPGQRLEPTTPFCQLTDTIHSFSCRTTFLKLLSFYPHSTLFAGLCSVAMPRRKLTIQSDGEDPMDVDQHDTAGGEIPQSSQRRTLGSSFDFRPGWLILLCLSVAAVKEGGEPRYAHASSSVCTYTHDSS